MSSMMKMRSCCPLQKRCGGRASVSSSVGPVFFPLSSPNSRPCLGCLSWPSSHPCWAVRITLTWPSLLLRPWPRSRKPLSTTRYPQIQSVVHLPLLELFWSKVVAPPHGSLSTHRQLLTRAFPSPVLLRAGHGGSQPDREGTFPCAPRGALLPSHPASCWRCVGLFSNQTALKTSYCPNLLEFPAHSSCVNSIRSICSVF